VLLGAPTLRLRGDYLAIVTLGFGEIVRIFMNNLNRR
jgi:ABC-type branched-subunit amino acid transport system permease subunit